MSSYTDTKKRTFDEYKVVPDFCLPIREDVKRLIVRAENKEAICRESEKNIDEFRVRIKALEDSLEEKYREIDETREELRRAFPSNILIAETHIGRFGFVCDDLKAAGEMRKRFSSNRITAHGGGHCHLYSESEFEEWIDSIVWGVGETDLIEEVNNKKKKEKEKGKTKKFKK